jgi:predicted GTPase
MGYDDAQLEALRRTIDASDAEIVVSGTPIDLAALVHTKKPVVRARYDLDEAGELGPLVDAFLDKALARRREASR